jgi:hypothetical protein
MRVLHVSGNLRITCTSESLPIGRTYYLVVSNWRGSPRVLFECDIEDNGRRIDYLKLDEFWGHVARPFLDFPQ